MTMHTWWEWMKSWCNAENDEGRMIDGWRCWLSSGAPLEPLLLLSSPEAFGTDFGLPFKWFGRSISQLAAFSHLITRRRRLVIRMVAFLKWTDAWWGGGVVSRNGGGDVRSTGRLCDGTAAVGASRELLSARKKRRRRSLLVFLTRVALVRLWSVWLLWLE